MGIEFVLADGDPVLLMGKESIWRYSDDPSPRGEEWRQREYDDSSWKEGQGWFGFGNGGEKTRIAPSTRHVTYYFRKAFDVPQGAKENFDGMVAYIMKDAGVAVYLNGELVLSADLDPAPNFETKGSFVVKDEEARYLRYDLHQSRNFLRDGTNIIAVELHAYGIGTANARFDMSLNLDDWEFGPEVVLSGNGRTVRDCVVADLDGDSVLDLLYSSSQGMPLSWRKGLGKFKFSGEVLLSSVGSSVVRAIADIDSDGDSDIVAWDTTGLRWLKNDGRGIFDIVPISWPADRRCSVVSPADLDNDGNLDLAAAWQNSNEANGIVSLINDGMGNFQEGNMIFLDEDGPSFQFTDIYCSDFDGNGTNDLLAKYSGGQQGYRRFLGLGDGAFSGAVEQSAIKFASSDTDIGDINGDGREDLVESDSYYLVDDSGTFTSEQVTYALGEVPHLFDFDGDGLLDVVSSSKSNGVLLALQSDPVQFPEGRVINPERLVVQSAHGDLNRDGYIDIIGVVGGKVSPGIRAFPNWMSPTAPRIYSASVEPQGAGAGTRRINWDIRRAGTATLFDPVGNQVDPLNVAISETTTFTLQVKSGNEIAERAITAYVNYFDSVVAPSGIPTGEGIVGLDVNGDGMVDLFKPLRSNEIAVYINTTDGYVESQRLSSGDDQPGMEFGDLNLDGIVDLKVTRTTNTGYVGSTGYLNDGGGRFTEMEFNGPRVGHWYDIDGDGDEDLLSPPMARINNAGVFEDVTFLASDPHYSQFDIGDINGDGSPDIAGIRTGDDNIVTVSWIPLEGGLMAGSERIISAAFRQIHEFWILDIDIDGDFDLVASIGSGGSLMWFCNKGSGEFTDALAVDATLGGKTINVRDVDGDGRFDLVNLPLRKWLRASGANAWVDELILPELADSSLVDIDGDGDLDLLGLRLNEVGAEETLVFLNRSVEFRKGGDDSDSDRDGLPDEFELAHFGNLDELGEDDFDGDGVSNVNEWQVGSAPDDSSSFFRVLTVTQNQSGVTVRFSRYREGVLRLETSDDLIVWNPAPGILSADQTELLLPKELVPQGNLYLRVAFRPSD
ncbi:MAG: VCBS repeat-containing protein [Verrucomicrobiae bacterium]|nr:VCBS repeat-containing protein [Verrucomicrobiae bacterium]